MRKRCAAVCGGPPLKPRWGGPARRPGPPAPVRKTCAVANQVVRIETRSSVSGRLTAHLEGREEARPITALVREEWDGRTAVTLGGNRRAAAELVAEVRKVKRSGRNGNPYVDFMIAGPPPFGSKGAWSKQKVLDWARASSDWITKTVGGESVVAAAALHVDELSPHVHAAAVPVVRDGRGPKFSWSLVRGAAAERAAGRRSADYRKQMADLQDSYFAEVGARFGLERGVKGSKAKHAEPDRVEGLKARLRETERQARERIEAARLDTERRVDDVKREADAKVKAAEEKAKAESKRAVAEAASLIEDAGRRVSAAEAERDLHFRRRSAASAEINRGKAAAAGALTKAGADLRTRRKAAAKERPPVSPERKPASGRGGRGSGGR